MQSENTVRQSGNVAGNTPAHPPGTLFDQFSYTHHMELGILLEKGS